MIKCSSYTRLEWYRRKFLRYNRLLYTTALLALTSPVAYAADTVLTFDDFDSGWGNWLDGGADAKLAETHALGAKNVGLQDNSGVASSTTLSSALDLTSYSELKIGFTYITTGFSGSEDFWLRYSSDGGSNWSTIKAFVNGVDFNNNTRETLELIFTNSEINFTANALVRFQADASGDADDVYIDNITISASSEAGNNTPVFPNDPISAANGTVALAYSGTLAATATDADADPLTYSKVSGPAWLSIAGDGTLSGTPTTANVGVNVFSIQVSDGNGGSATATLNITVDAAAGGGFTQLTLDDFDSGWGNWLDGGNDCKLAEQNAIGAKNVGLQDNSGVPSSTTLASVLNLTGYNELKIGFTYITTGFSGSEDFWLRYSSDGGSNWTTIKAFVNGVDFNNNTRETLELIFTSSEISFTTNALFRFQADASGNSDDVYIDNISILASNSSGGNNAPVFTIDPISGANGAETIAYSGTLAGSATDANADPLTYTKVSGPAWLSIATNGALSGTPATTDVGINAFTVQVSDGNGGSATAMLNITVDAAPNNAPVFIIDPISGSNGTEAVAYSGTIAGSATDADADPLTYTKVSGPTWLTIATNGALSGTPATADVGANVFSVQVSDGNGSNATAMLNITVDAAPNNAPVFTNNPINGANGAEAVAYSGTLAGSATDADADPLTYVKVSGPAWLSFATNGALSGTPATADVGANAFSVQVSDGNGGNATATLIITVNAAVNQAPSFTADPFSKANSTENSTYSGSIAGDASDPEADPLSFAKLSGPTWLSIAASGSLTGTPTTADLGINAFTVQVSDGNGGSASATLNITVVAASGGFTLLTFDDFEAGWGNWLDGGIHARIAQSNCIGGDCANIQAFGADSTITLANALDLSSYNSLKIDFTYMPKGIDGTEEFWLEYSLDGGTNWSILKSFVNGVDFNNDIRETLELTFTDNEIDLTANALVRFQSNSSGTGDDIYIDNISISAAFINYFPVFASDPINVANAAKDWAYSGTLANLVTDRNGDPMAFAKLSGPAWLAVATDGTFTGTPALGDVGANVFTVQASDGVGGITTATLNITVDLSLAPSFAASPFNTENAVENTAYSTSITGSASDPDGDPLSFAKLSGPAWLNVAANGALTGTPPTKGINTFSIEVSDGNGGSDTATLNIFIASLLGGYPDYGISPTTDEWLMAFDLTGADAEMDANPDGDAWDNFHEYAYGGDPTSTVELQAVLDIQITSNVFTVSHTQLRNATSLGIDYQFQLAKNATNPEWLDVTPDDINVQLLGASYKLVTYSGYLPFDIDTDTSTSIGRLVVTKSGPFADQGAMRTHAELVIANHTKTQSGNIYDDRFGYAAPQGIVDNSSPWMHVRIPFSGDPQWPADRGTRLYHYKLSMDPTLTTNVITETPKRWSFFNPSTKLTAGTWYWTAGYSTLSDPANITWLSDVYEFVISGTEEQYLPPSADEVWAIAQQKSEPKLLMRPGDFGTLLDIQDTTSDALITHANTILTDGIANADTVAKLVLAYGASGDTVYRDEALARYPNVSITAGSGFGIRTFLGMGIAFLDIMGSELDPAMEAELVANMLELAKVTPEGFIHTLLDRYEHRHYESHVVQKVIHMLMFAGLSIGDRHPEAEEMFKYAYELWLYKGPHGGRSDGSWHNGFGYMSVNEDQLMATPWILGQLTGFDYMMHPWYRNNPKAMSYLRAYGNPGQYYGDKAADGYGITTGGPAVHIARSHAYTHPENRWMRWQARNATTNALLGKVKKMADQWHRWLYLQIRKYYADPDFINVQTPVATADAYRDVGYVAAHSNITDAATNFMTTMRSSPFSSSHKSHASQNAFTTAYGGLPLFYRTGWRKKGDINDYRQSKAFNLIMPNDVGQKRADKSAYAFLPRFAHGDRMSYWIGDASNSYPDATGIYRFRRHMVHLKPNTLVIYDEIESTEAATTWTYTLNAHNEIKTQGDNIISVHNTLGLATANLFSSSALSTTVTGPTFDHWNTRITTTEQSPSVRFLNVIELTPSTDINEVVAALPATGTDLITVDAGDYTIVAQVDPNQPARLEIRSSDGNVALLYAEGVNTLSVDGTTVLSGRYDSSTLFMEKNTPRGDIVEELVDVLPDAVTYGNKY